MIGQVDGYVRMATGVSSIENRTARGLNATGVLLQP